MLRKFLSSFPCLYPVFYIKFRKIHRDCTHRSYAVTVTSIVTQFRDYTRIQEPKLGPDFSSNSIRSFVNEK